MENTSVVFREEGDGDILAIFPDIIEGVGLVSCYSHNGQHSVADIGYCRDSTAPANNYVELKSELESLGYNLDILESFPKREQLSDPIKPKALKKVVVAKSRFSCPIARAN